MAYCSGAVSALENVMLSTTGRRIYVNQTGSTFRASPSAGGGGLCPAFFNTNGVNQDFCAVGWCRPKWSGSSQYVLFSLANGFLIKTSSSNVVEGRIAARDGTIATAGADQNTQALNVATPGSLVLNEWNLVALSFNASTKVATVTVINSANPTGSAASSSAYSVVPPTAAQGCPDGMAVGGGGGFIDWIGDIGTLAVFGRTCSLADLQAIWASKLYLAPLSYIRDTYSEPDYVAFNVSIPGAVLNESGSTVSGTWIVAGTSTTGASGAAPAAPTAWVYLDSGRSRGTSLDTARPSWLNNVGAGVTTYESHDGDSFFTRSTISGAAAAGGVAGKSSALVAMYAGLAVAPGRHMAIVASNSRGVRRPSAGGQTVPERHSEAYMRAALSRISGVLNGRFWLDTSEATNAFGLKISQGGTVQSSGTVAILHTTSGLMDFTRCWTGGDNTGAGVSQGQGLYLADESAAIGYKFTPESGSRFTTSNAIKIRVHALAFPGHCGSLLYRRTRSASQAAGTDLDGFDTTLSGLNTSLVSRVYVNGTDTYNSGTKTLTVRTNLIASGVKVGHIAVNTTATCAGEVSSISWNGTDTTIVLSNAFGINPADGDTLHFGPWRTFTFSASFPSQSGGDPLVNRGLLIKAPSVFPTGTMGPILLGQDAWSTDVDGVVIGHAGYSGNGYQNQLTDCWQYHNGEGQNAISNFYAKMFDASFTYDDAASFSVLLHHADQQVASPGLFNYTTTVALACPDATVAYMGDQVHGVEADVIAWDSVVLAQSSRLAVTVTGDATLGTLAEQWAAGHRSDAAHPSARGHLACATANIARGGPLASLSNRPRSFGGSLSLRRTLGAISAMDALELLFSFAGSPSAIPRQP